MSESITAGQQPFSRAVVSYFHVETRGERLRRLSNAAADVADRAMAMGYEEAAFVEYAEMADELATLADFIEPPASLTITSGTFAAVDGWVFNNGGEYGTSRC